MPNPYELDILDNNSDSSEVGEIIAKSHKDKSVTVLCGNNKLIKMSGIRLYGPLSRMLTSFYIKHFIKN